MLEEFSAGRRTLTIISEDAARQARALGEDGVAERIAREAVKLAADEFNFAIVGEFKRGKSTLANALMGADVLPTAAVPLTSVVTAIRWGPEPGGEVRFLDGRMRGIRLSELESYTTERGNPGNTKGVAEVELEYPAELLRAGVRLFDTPGVGSVYESNTAVTLDFLPRADAVLLVLSADQPASQSELEFLQQIRAHVDKLFIVLNKVDLVSVHDRDEAVAFCRRQLERVLPPHTLRLYPVSARRALDGRGHGDIATLEASGFGPLEADLTRFLDEHRGTVLLAAGRRRLASCLDELFGRVKLRRQAALMPLATLDDRIRDFQTQSERVVWSEAAIGGLLAGARRRLVDALEATHAPFVAARSPDILAALERAYAEGPRRRRPLIAALRTTLEGAVQCALDAWVDEQASRVHREITALLERLQEQANTIIAEVRRLVRELFASDVTPALELGAFSVDPPLARVDSAFALMLEELPLLLPGPLARRAIRRRFLAAVPQELTRNLSAATAEFRQRLADAERAFQYEFVQRVETMLASLADVLSRARDDRAREESGAAEVTDELARRAADLAALRAQLDGTRTAA